jgi:hypothetical protein
MTVSSISNHCFAQPNMNKHTESVKSQPTDQVTAYNHERKVSRPAYYARRQQRRFLNS